MLTARSVPVQRTRFQLTFCLLDLPIMKKLYLIMGILIATIALVIALTSFALHVMSSVRAAAVGEDHWGQAQKTAVHSLIRYAMSQNEDSYQNYREALRVPNAYGKANLEFQKSEPDIAVLNEAFLEANMHPHDVTGVNRLFTSFHGIPFVAEALQAWARTQVLMGRLRDIGDELRASILSGKATKGDLAGYIRSIDDLNEHFSSERAKFSVALWAASRWATEAFMWVMIGGSTLAGVISILIALYISKDIVRGFAKISAAAAEAAKGNLKVSVAVNSNDELGQLGHTFNQMVQDLGVIDGIKTELAAEKISVLLHEEQQRKDEFLAELAHEIRNPLAVITGVVQVAAMDGLLPNAVEILEHQVDRLVYFIDGLLDVSSFNNRHIAMKRQAIDVHSALTWVVQLMQALPRVSGLRFVLPNVDETLWVEADQIRLEQLLFNLLEAAVKVTPSGGVIRLEAKREGDFSAIHICDDRLGAFPEQVPLGCGAEEGFEFRRVEMIAEMLCGTVSVPAGGEGGVAAYTLRLPLAQRPVAELLSLNLNEGACRERSNVR